MNPNNNFRYQIDLWLILLFMNSLGWTFGLVLASLLVGVVGISLESITGLILAGILGGFVISLLSMFVVHKSIQGVGIWILASTLGWTLALLGTTFIMQAMEGVAGWTFGGAIGGLVFGLVQSYGFKPEFRKSVLWIILNAIGWLGAYGIGYLLPSSLGMERITLTNTIISKSMLGWVILGTFAVMLLVLMFSARKRDKSDGREQWWP